MFGKKQQFDHVISLGQQCQGAYQIRRYFGLQQTHFFDYKRTSIECLRDIFDQDFKDITLPENLSFSREQNNITDTRYNLILSHDFFNEKGLVPEDYMSMYPNVRSKFDHLIGKIKSVLDSHSSCLFVYTFHRFKCKRYNDLNAALELETALKKRSPRLRFKILYVDNFTCLKSGKIGKYSEAVEYSYKIESQDKVYQEQRKDVAIERWKGSDLAWDRIFRQYTIQPENVGWLKRKMYWISGN